MEAARHLELRQSLGAVSAQLALGRVALQDDGRVHLLAERLVRYREGDRLAHRRVAQEDIVNLQRGDLLAAPVDQFLQSPSEGEVAIRINLSLIAGAEPAVDKGGRVRL